MGQSISLQPKVVIWWILEQHIIIMALGNCVSNMTAFVIPDFPSATYICVYYLKYKYITWHSIK